MTYMEYMKQFFVTNNDIIYLENHTFNITKTQYQSLMELSRMVLNILGT